jgi:hypothetical protein
MRAKNGFIGIQRRASANRADVMIERFTFSPQGELGFIFGRATRFDR